jgi:hypothetical protein
MRLGGPQGRSGRVRKISPPTGIWSPDCPARNQSLYRLSYLAHSVTLLWNKKKLPSHLRSKKNLQGLCVVENLTPYLLQKEHSNSRKTRVQTQEGNSAEFVGNTEASLATAHRLKTKWNLEETELGKSREGGWGKTKVFPALLCETYKVFGETWCLPVRNKENVMTDSVGYVETSLSTNLADYTVSSQTDSIIFCDNQLL